MTTSDKRNHESAIMTPEGPIFDPDLVPNHDPPLMGYMSRQRMGRRGYTREQIFMCHPPVPGDPDYDDFEDLRRQET